MKKVSYLLAGLAMLATGAASMGCIVLVFDEPTAPKDLV